VQQDDFGTTKAEMVKFANDNYGDTCAVFKRTGTTGVKVKPPSRRLYHNRDVVWPSVAHGAAEQWNCSRWTTKGHSGNEIKSGLPLFC
jgi:glutathione peroxidase-family protein